MGSYIVKQPNGLYCRFSTSADTITHYNMTEEEYLEICAEKARKEAKEILENHLYPFEQIKRDFMPTNNSLEEFESFLNKMGDTSGIGEENRKRVEEILKSWKEEGE